MSTQGTERQARTVCCPLCGGRFDPALHLACQQCPLHQGCAMACCPHCGYSTIVGEQSRLGRWLTRILKKEQDHDPMAKP